MSPSVQKETSMISKINYKGLVVGLLIGLVTAFVLGAVSSSNEGTYQLSMATNDSYVIYGRIHTGTGKVETWKYLISNNGVVPFKGDNTKVLHGPDSTK
jgi:hypothetical protein